jgi:hypothetical protein
LPRQRKKPQLLKLRLPDWPQSKKQLLLQLLKLKKIRRLLMLCSLCSKLKNLQEMELVEEDFRRDQIHLIWASA